MVRYGRKGAGDGALKRRCFVGMRVVRERCFVGVRVVDSVL